MTPKLPASASVALPRDGVRLLSPSAARNAGALTDVLRDLGVASGTALEIASGTGQHVVAFATALPGVHWHPTEPSPERRSSIDAYARAAGLGNIAPARDLDAAAPGWGAAVHPCDLVVCINLLHLISDADARCAVTEAAAALAPGGTLVLYGPFMRDGVLVSDGDARFDAELRASDPAIGYKDARVVQDWLHAAGCRSAATRNMPANNLCLIAKSGIDP